MKVLLVFAHPERHSLSGALRDVAVAELQAQGHEVRVSDLYAEGWKASVDRADFPEMAEDERLRVAGASGQAFAAGSLTEDVKAEQEKLLWADTLILQFPLWWYSMPAILKGWVDRVYALGFAYGVGEQSDTHWGDRFGEGTLAGKRAMLIVTAGGWATHYAPRGVNGPIEDILFPINHGILYYPGYTVLPALRSLPCGSDGRGRVPEGGGSVEGEDADHRDHCADPLPNAERRRLSGSQPGVAPRTR